MKNFQKKLSVLLAFVLCLSMSCFGVLAENEIPSDLPEGTIKIAEGIYAYTSSVALLNTIGPVNIGTVPAYGNIIQPGQFSNVIVNTGHRYICIKSTQSILDSFESRHIHFSAKSGVAFSKNLSPMAEYLP